MESINKTSLTKMEKRKIINAKREIRRLRNKEHIRNGTYRFFKCTDFHHLCRKFKMRQLDTFQVEQVDRFPIGRIEKDKSSAVCQPEKNCVEELPAKNEQMKSLKDQPVASRHSRIQKKVDSLISCGYMASTNQSIMRRRQTVTLPNSGQAHRMQSIQIDKKFVSKHIFVQGEPLSEAHHEKQRIGSEKEAVAKANIQYC